MTLFGSLARGFGAYAIAQMLSGIEMGLVIALGVLCFDWDPTMVASVMPLGLVLVVVQTPLLARAMTLVRDRWTGRSSRLVQA